MRRTHKKDPNTQQKSGQETQMGKMSESEHIECPPSTHLKIYDHKMSGKRSLEQERDIPAPTRSQNNGKQGKLEYTWLATPALCLTPLSPPTPSTLAFRHLLACTRFLVPGFFKPLRLDLRLPWDALPPLARLQRAPSLVLCPWSPSQHFHDHKQMIL